MKLSTTQWVLTGTHDSHAPTAGSKASPPDFRIQTVGMDRLATAKHLQPWRVEVTEMTDPHSALEVAYRCCLSWLQALLTLSHKYFALFNRSTCALSVPCQYLGLEEIHLPSSGCMLKQPYSWMLGTTIEHMISHQTVLEDCHLCCVSFQTTQSNKNPCTRLP